MTRSALPARRTSSATANTSACARSRALAGAKSPRQTLTRSCTERCCSTRLFRTRTCMDAEPCLVAMSRAGIWHVHATCAEAMPCRSWCEAQHPGIVPIQQAYATSLTSSSPVAAPRGAPVSSQSWLIHDGNSFILAPTIQHLMECDTARPQITRYLRVVRMMWHTGAHPALLPDLQNQVCIRFSLREQQRPGQCLSCSACSVKARAWYPTGVLCACSSSSFRSGMRRPSLKSVVCTGAALSVGISGCSTSRYGGRSFAATCICTLRRPGSAHEVCAQRMPLHASGFVTCWMSASTPHARSSEVSWNITGVPSEVGNMSICITWWHCALLQ